MRWYSYYFWNAGLNFTQLLIQLPIRALMDRTMYLLLCLTPIIIVLQLYSLPFSYYYSAYTITPVPKHEMIVVRDVTCSVVSIVLFCPS